MTTETEKLPTITRVLRVGLTTSVVTYNTGMTSKELAEMLNAQRNASQLSYGIHHAECHDKAEAGTAAVVVTWFDSCD